MVLLFVKWIVLKINSRDREIQRLTAMLEGGRPTHALNTDCCYRDTEGRLARLQDNINVLRREKLTLEDRLKGKGTYFMQHFSSDF